MPNDTELPQGVIMGSDSLQKPTTREGVAKIKTRLQKANRARDIVDRIVADSDQRDRFFRKLRAQLDGNPPYNQSELVRNGQAYRANYNTMEAESMQDTAVSPHYDIYNAGQVYFHIAYDQKKIAQSPELVDGYSKTVTAIANRMVDEWYGFDANNQPCISDTVWFGKGFLMWEDEQNWRYKYVAQHRVKVPNTASNNIDELTVMVILQDYRLDELWGYIKNAKESEARGWHSKTVMEAISNAQPKDPQTSATGDVDYMAIQQQLNDNDIWFGYTNEQVRCAHIYNREFDDKITHSIITLDRLKRNEGNRDEPKSHAEAQQQARDNPPEFQDDFLFQKVGQYDNWRQAIAPFFLKNSSGSWNGSSGLGKSVYAMLQVKNRLECSTDDLAFIATMIGLQSKSGKSMEQAALIPFGPFLQIPPDFDVQQATIRGNLEDPLSCITHKDQLLQRNTGVYRQPLMDRDRGNPPTLGQVQLAYQDRAQLTNSMVSRRYRDQDKCYTEVVRRMFMDDEFKKRCRAQGLPDECLKHENVDSVKASRVIGNGSPQNRLLAIQQTGSVFNRLPEGGQNNWIDDLIAAAGDKTLVDRWNPRPSSKSGNDHQRMAELENGVIAAGGAVNPSDTDNDVIHLDQHIAAKALALQSAQQGADPLKIVDFVDRMGGHEQTHWQRLQQDKSREAQFKALAQTNMQLVKMADELRGHVDKSMAQRQENAQKARQAQMDPMTQVKVQQTRQKMAHIEAKFRQSYQNKELQAEQDRRKAEQDMILKDATTAAEIRRKAWSAFTPDGNGD